MMRHIVSLVLALLVGGSASAHHSRAFFADDVTSFEGEVVRFDDRLRQILGILERGIWFRRH